MDQRPTDRSAGATTEFEKDVAKLFMETMKVVAKQERDDVGTESLLSALVSDDWDAGSAIAPGMKASGSLGGLIASRRNSVWVSADAGDGMAGAPDDELEIDAFWREVREERAKVLRWKNRKKQEGERMVAELPPMTGAVRTCLRKALETAREEGTVSVRVRHVARALIVLSDTRAREIMVVAKLDVPAAVTALDALRGSEEPPELGAVIVLRKAGTFGKSGNPLTRKFTAWILGGGAGFGSAVVGVVRSETRRVAVRRGASRMVPADMLLAMLALDRSLAVAGRELPSGLAEANRGAELLRRHGARQDALSRTLLPSTGVTEEDPAEIESPAEFDERLLHVTQLTAAAEGSPTVGTTHLLAALLDRSGTNAESLTEIERVLTGSGVDIAGLRAEPELKLSGAARSA